MKTQFAVLILCLSAISFTPAADWAEITGSSNATIPPAAADDVVWRTDLPKAFTEAKDTGRPLFVSWRCLPCKQCAEFDKGVLDGSPTLTPLLKRFVTLRMTDASHLDHRIFPYRDFQDLDLSWWAYFMSPEGRVYGVFGGKDHVSDKTRISEAALVNTMGRVLEHHYDSRRASWDVDGPLPDLRQRPQTPKDLATTTDFGRDRPHFSKQACIHCHQVADIENFGKMKSDSFNVDAFTQPWPLPENAGIVVDRDDGLKVTGVTPGGAAEGAGIQLGDSLAMAGGRRLFGQADFRGVLHRAPLGDATVEVGWLRNGEYKQGELELSAGWRATEISWRKSVYDGVYGEWIGFFPLKGPNQGKGSMSLRPFMGPSNKVKQNPWYQAGLRPGMEIVSVNGKADDWNSREVLTWFKLNHQAGDDVVIRVKGGQEFSATLPLKRPK